MILDSLEIEVKDTQASPEGLKSLLSSLTKLKNVMTKINALDSDGIKKLRDIGKSVKDLSEAGQLGGLKTTISQLNRLGKINFDGINSTAEAVERVKEALNFETPVPEDATIEIPSVVETEQVDTSRIGTVLTNIKESYNEMLAKHPKVATAVEGLGKAFEGVSSKLSGAKKRLDIFFNQIKRIALYRAIRSFLKMLTQGFSEGINNAYQWSKALGGTFASSMDRMATSFAYLKNSVGAMSIPLLNAIAPAVDYLVDKFVDLLNIINQVFARLSGASTWTKAIKTQTVFAESTEKAAKAMRGMLAGFDEINNIGGNSNSDSSSTDNGGFKFEENLVDTKKVDDIINKIKDILTWIVAIKLAVKGIKFASNFTEDLDKLAGIGLIIGGITLAISELIQYINDPTWENFGGIIEGVGLAIVGLGLVITSTPLLIAGAITAVLGLIAANWDKVKNWFGEVENTLSNAIDTIHNNITNQFGIIGVFVGSFLEGVIGTVKGMVTTVKDFLDGLFTGVRQILDGIIKIFKGDFKGGLSQVFSGIQTLVGTLLTTIKNLVSTAFTNIKTLVSNLFTYIGNHVSSKVKSIINNYVVNPLNRLIGWINDKLHFSYGGLNIAGVQIIHAFDVQLAHLNSIPSLDVGTNYVPQDQLALIHQGEAVVPKQFNKQEFFGNNEEVVEKLDELISVVNSKEFRAYISQREIGQSAVNYINKQSRIQGASLIGG